MAIKFSFKSDKNTFLGNIVHGKIKETPFRIWYEYMKEWEGGYVNHPHDPGGETNKGVTWKTFVALAKKVGYEPTKELFLQMPDELHEKIARIAFWNPIARYIDNDCISFFIVDYTWGSGQWGVLRTQRVLNRLGAKLKEDKIFGKKTAKAINKIAKKIGASELLRHLQQERRKHLLVDLPRYDSKYLSFVRGWANRLNDLSGKLKYCIEQVHRLKKNAKKGLPFSDLFS